MRIAFQHLAWLVALLPAAVAVFWLARTTRTPMRRWRHVASLTVAAAPSASHDSRRAPRDNVAEPRIGPSAGSTDTSGCR